MLLNPEDKQNMIQLLFRIPKEQESFFSPSTGNSQEMPLEKSAMRQLNRWRNSSGRL